MVTRAKPKSGQPRVGMMVRIAPDIRERLEKAAEEAGRSLGQEVELRLDRSFELTSIIDSAIKSTANLAMSFTTERLDELRAHMVEMAGGDDLFRLWGYLSWVIHRVEDETGKKIRDDEFTRNKAERELLGAIPDLFRNLPGTYSELRQQNAKAITSGEPPVGLAALGMPSGALPPLGHKGPWPPTQE